VKSLAVITLDSVRFDQIIAANTPFLDSLGKIYPARSHADSTFPSHMALLSGNLNWPDFISNKSMLKPPWMPSWFKSKGYTTICAAALPWIRKEFFGKDFMHFFEQPLSADGSMMPLPQMLRDVDWVAQEPNFLCMNIGESHFPYDPDMKNASRQLMLDDMINNPKQIHPKMGEAMKSDQRETISWVDARLGRFFQEREDWIVFITADHGEMFGEHGLWIHGHGCFEEEVNVFAVCNDWDALITGDFE